MSRDFPLNDEQKNYLANGVYQAVTQNMPDIVEENNLPTNVGGGIYRWNFINRNLTSNPQLGFQISFPKRGAWRFLVLLDMTSNLSFSVMTEQNLRKLQKSPPMREHYLEALVSENKNRTPIEGQVCFECVQLEREPSVLEKLRQELLYEFTNVIKEHVLILFDYDFTGVTSVRAVLLTPKLEIALSDDWTSYMRSIYVPAKSILAELISEQEDELVTLKRVENDVDDVLVSMISSKELNSKRSS